MEDDDNLHGVHLFRLYVDNGDMDDDEDDDGGNDDDDDEFESSIIGVLLTTVSVDDNKLGVIQSSLIVPHVIRINFCKRISTVFFEIFTEHFSGTISFLFHLKKK